MQVIFKEPVLVHSGDGHAYDFAAGAHDIDDSLLGYILEKYRASVDRRSIPQMEDRIYMFKAQNPGVNTALQPQAVVENYKPAEGGMPKQVQIDYPAVSQEGNGLGANQEFDNAGNVVNTKVTTTTVPAGLGLSETKTEGASKLPHLVNSQDTQVGKQYAQTAPVAPGVAGHKSGHGHSSSSHKSSTGHQKTGMASTGTSTPGTSTSTATPAQKAEVAK